MSILHTSRAPWWMIALFSIAAVVFFVLAAGQDIGWLPEAMAPDAQTTVLGNVRQELMRLEKKAVQAEGEIIRGAGQVAEHTGERLKSFGCQQPEALPLPEQAAPPGPSAEIVASEQDSQGRGKLLSHNFSLAEQGFQAIFVTDRSVSSQKVYFFSKPAMWVIDLPGSWRNAATRINLIDQGFISQVVIGEHHDYLRLSFHFREKNQHRPTKSPIIVRQDNGFAVIVPPVDS